RTHSRCGLHTRAVTVFRDPLPEGFRHFVSSMPAPVASGWSDLPGGACTHWKAPPCHGAHPKRTRCTSFTLNLDGSVSSGCLEIHGFALAAASRAAFTGARPVSRAQRPRRSLRERRGVNLDSRFTP